MCSGPALLDTKGATEGIDIDQTFNFAEEWRFSLIYIIYKFVSNRKSIWSKPEKLVWEVKCYFSIFKWSISFLIPKPDFVSKCNNNSKKNKGKHLFKTKTLFKALVCVKCFVFVLLKYQYVHAELKCKITRNQILPPILYKFSCAFLIQMFSESFTWVQKTNKWRIGEPVSQTASTSDDFLPSL